MKGGYIILKRLVEETNLSKSNGKGKTSNQEAVLR